jgi:outer membrane lipoprotein
MSRHYRFIILSLLSLILLSGCASKVPKVISTPVAGDIRVDEVQQDQHQFTHAKVRWGGDIVSVENLSQETRIEILSRPLDDEGRPRDERRSIGRFIARIEGYLEPEEYPRNRQITITGKLLEVVKRPVGEYPYPYPVVEVDAYYLWPEQKVISHPYYYDPFYDPFYYPYWRRYPYYW